MGPSKERLLYQMIPLDKESRKELVRPIANKLSVQVKYAPIWNQLWTQYRAKILAHHSIVSFDLFRHKN
jgi:hypothetical protein